MRINEVESYIQNLPISKSKRTYIVPVRVLGTCNIQSDTPPQKARIIVNKQIIGNQPSDIAFEDVGGDEIVAMCECYGNMIVNTTNHNDLENLIQTFTLHFSCPLGDFTLKKGRIEIVGNIIGVDFEQQSIAVKVDHVRAIHAY